MTLALAFACSDGLVLAADSEMSTDTERFDGDKAWYLQFPKNAATPSLKVGIVGAGYLSFLVRAKELIESGLSPEMGLGEARDVVEDAIDSVHKDHIYPYGPAYERSDVNIFLLVGIVATDGRALLSSTLTAVTSTQYQAHGVGQELANFLVARAGITSPRMQDAMFLSAQALMYARRHVPGVGGKSRILVMSSLSATNGFVKQSRIQKLERFAERFDEAIRPVMFGGTDKSVTDQDFTQRLDKLRTDLLEVRDIRQNVVIPVLPAHLQASAGTVGVLLTSALLDGLPDHEQSNSKEED